MLMFCWQQGSQAEGPIWEELQLRVLLNASKCCEALGLLLQSQASRQQGHTPVYFKLAIGVIDWVLLLTSASETAAPATSRYSSTVAA